MNGSKKAKLKFCSGLVEVMTRTQLKYCGRTFKIMLKNLSELEWFCKKEWARILTQHCESLIFSYWKHLVAVIAATGATTIF